jgi:GT2 family glycosyltransferase
MTDAAPESEHAYLRRYPDVAGAIAAGAIASAREHFLNYGRFEGRIWPEPSAVSPAAAPPASEPLTVPHHCDAILLSRGFLFVTGWIDDRFDRLAFVAVGSVGDQPFLRAEPCRHRREDVERHLELSCPCEAGFWQLFAIPPEMAARPVALRLELASGESVPVAPVNPVRLSLREHLDSFLGFYGRRALIGSLVARSFAELDAGLGNMIARMHETVRATRQVSSEGRYGHRPAKPLLSFVCCLHGIPDFLFLQIARFADCARLDHFEFIYVNNTPALEEDLHRDAELAAMLFETTVRVISFDQNTGFSYANNFGVSRAMAQTVVLINPDVFPREAASLDALLRFASGKARRAITGGKLFYADGTVMHEGMVIIPDLRLSALARSPVLTVEHPRKGFSDRGGSKTMKVPAVSGAMMVIDRNDFVRAGGFDEGFIHGHYEDADLCLRFATQGGMREGKDGGERDWKVLCDPALAFWHYEGCGSIRQPEQEGALQVNRWRFSRKWQDFLSGR